MSKRASYQIMFFNEKYLSVSKDLNVFCPIFNVISTTDPCGASDIEYVICFCCVRSTRRNGLSEMTYLPQAARSRTYTTDGTFHKPQTECKWFHHIPFPCQTIYPWWRTSLCSKISGLLRSDWRDTSMYLTFSCYKPD